MKHLTIVFILILIVSGCAHVISKEERAGADGETPLSEVFDNPDINIGKKVILGGIIAGSLNTGTSTYIEVVEKQLGFTGRPKDTDQSLGRFIIEYDGYLDTVIYAPGKGIAVAGEVLGKTEEPLGEIIYPYLLIKSREIHLVKPGEAFPISFGLGIGIGL